ncbi:MAG TPA: MFS transporter [Thermoleophilaceae bacterium]|nr:MFS transporter [Thermoleophilaceae bacterium]
MRRSYLYVLAGAVACYASLGAVVRIIPGYVGDQLQEPAAIVGLAIGAPALTAVVARPLGGRLADARGTLVVASGGAVVMALGALPMFGEHLAPLLVSRLIVGVGEGAMMSASVLWLLRLAGPERRGRALGHIGLANYAGLTAGPLLADALGGPAHATRVFAAAALLPLLPLGLFRAAEPGDVPDNGQARPASLRSLALIVLAPGLGLLLVNIGYAALLSFGAAAVGGAAVLVLPAYAITVILVRTLAGSVPDHLGGRRTLIAAAPTAAAGLLVVAVAPTTAPALAGVVILGLGQGLAVPALGLLALEPVPAADQGAASGAFFAWFDAGVGIGGPLAGLAAGVGGPDTALTVAAVAVAGTVPAALLTPRARVRQTAGSSSSARSSSGGQP